jgi:hypothetical protein
MGVIVATTAGLILWIVLGAIGVKAIDSFMIAVVIAVVAATVRMVLPHLPGHREA